MLTKRIIACLDMDDGRVVKGVRFQNLRDSGDPAKLAAAYADAGADEIVLLDITATSGDRKTLLDVVRRTAPSMFVPFTVGGGIRSLADATAVFEAGADKVTVNSAMLLRGPARPNREAPANCCSPPWIGTAPVQASTANLPPRSLGLFQFQLLLRAAPAR
jgi:imidazoleglycerol phosphate synthase cyclase subunit